MTTTKGETVFVDYATLIERFMTDNSLFTGRYDRLWSRLEAHRIDERMPGDGTLMATSELLTAWRWLQRQDEASLAYWSKH